MSVNHEELRTSLEQNYMEVQKWKNKILQCLLCNLQSGFNRPVLSSTFFTYPKAGKFENNKRKLLQNDFPAGIFIFPHPD